ncbi:unnamed protein product [Leptidea sinapis]|uniref:Uncharacterized protein n=1 Tax=Leptidea sinapis TaxID=189913 RepID=A0A5E4QPQ3_9NEOP|nr:unnamed protein product [Leptidea sinapis]
MWLFWFLLTIVLIKLFNKVTSGKCYDEKVMSGEVVVVTGASGGIGYETALEIAQRGAKVIIACRDAAKGQRAVNEITKRTKNTKVRYMHLDLTSLASVRNFVEELKSSEAKLDVLVNNAGAICTKREYTADGLLKDMQINYFGPFLLTVLLVPLLKKSAPSRILVVASAWHKFGTAEDINDKRYCYIQSYANSKFCNVVFSKELARRLAHTGVVVNSLNPGQVNTSLYKSSSFLERLRSLLLYFFFKTPNEGAQTSLYVAVSDYCDQVTGKYFEDCAEASPSARTEDIVLAKKLWQLTEGLVKLTPEETSL